MGIRVRPSKLALWVVVITAVLATWAPYLGAFDEPGWVGPLPLALTWVLGWNVVLTVCAVAMYAVHFRPLHERLLEHPLAEPEVEPR